MPDEIILAESYGSVLADAHVPCVITQFHGFANSTEFKRIMETALAYYLMLRTTYSYSLERRFAEATKASF